MSKAAHSNVAEATKNNTPAQVSEESPAIMVDANGKPVVEVSQFLALLNQGGEMSDFDIMNLPDLENAPVVPLSLVEDYWSPETKGESRKMAFLGMKTVEIPAMDGPNAGELRAVTYVEFVERRPDGSGKMVTSAAARLVGFFTDHDVPRGTFWHITYEGKVQNKTNAFKSDAFRINMIIVPHKGAKATTGGK